ncbi:DUF2576 domain-containing protein [bacterium]|nr:DUF2576 domain-containing protein [bacterium]
MSRQSFTRPNNIHDFCGRSGTSLNNGIFSPG